MSIETEFESRATKSITNSPTAIQYKATEADVYSFAWRPSTTCVARSAAVDSLTQ